MLKKVFVTMVLAASIFSFGNVLSNSTASAQDVWAYGRYDNGRQIDYYFQTESIVNAPEDVTVRVLTVVDGRGWDAKKYIFDRRSMRYGRFTGVGIEQLGYISENPFAAAVWHALQPYLGKTC